MVKFVITIDSILRLVWVVMKEERHHTQTYSDLLNLLYCIILHFQVDVTNRSAVGDLSNYIDNGEWELVDLQTRRNVKYYACCPEPFPDVTFWFHLRRRTTYYTFNVIIPCLILSILTLASFMLPANSGEKVSLGLTVLLAFSVFMLLIAESMPATSEFVPLIGQLYKV